MQSTENRFCFVAPMFNASSTLQRMLHSIYGQSYDNWKIILIDDVSSYVHKERSAEILQTFKMFKNEDKLQVIWNSTKKWEVENVLNGIDLCEDDDIICRIDADDSLCDLDALAIFNSVYVQTNCDVAWSMHRWGQSDKNISNSMPNFTDPYKYPWVSSHMKSFRKRLINNIPYENFINMDGDLVRRAGDQAIYLPVLARTNKRVFIPRALYNYTIDEQNGKIYQTEDAKFQKIEAEFIRARGFVSSGETWEQHLSVNNALY